MARTTQSDLLHQWCNRGIYRHESAGNLSVTHSGKVLMYDGSIVGVNLTIPTDEGSKYITLYADHVDKPYRSRVSPSWIPGEIRRGMPDEVHFAVRVSKHVLGYHLHWITGASDDTHILRNLGLRMMGHWGDADRDDAKLKRMKAKRHRAMQVHQDEITERAGVLTLLNALTRDHIPELMVYHDALIATKWTDSEMEVAQVYSDKWAEVDNARVAEHGAFGHVSWEERRRRERERYAENKAKEDKEREHWTPERIADLIKAWQEGKTTYEGRSMHGSGIPWWVTGEFNKFTHLRISGNDVETSRGAKVGIRAAKRLLQLCERVWASGVDLVYTWDNPGPDVGIYKLQYISQTEVVIGCHTLLRTTIEAFKPVFMEHAARLYKLDARENDILAEELRPILDTAVSD